ncbi:unnamed protein product [Schistosoma rodhaini]|nr:unnamed protein product [Schistosoma rodhaini]
MADEKPRRKLILHFDARNTLFLSDKSYRFTIEEALNNYISGIVWGQLKDESERNVSSDLKNNSETSLPTNSNPNHSTDPIETNESQNINSVKSQVLNEMNKNENHEHNSCIATTTTTTGNRQPYEGENFENLTSNELANFKATLTYWNRLPEPLCIRQPIPNSISIYKLLEKQIVKLTSDRGRIRKYLGNFTQTPEGLPFRQLFNEHLEMLKLTPLESNNSPYCLCVNSGKTTTNTTDTTNTTTTHTTNNTTYTTHTTDTTNTTNTTTNNNDDEYYHYLMPAFYRLLTWLIETKRQFAIFIRTYGKDGEHILSAIEAYIHGKHSQEKAPINAKQFLPIDYTKWYLKRSEHEPMFQLLKEIHNDHDPNDDKQLINISKDPYEIYQIWSKQIGVINITDDFMYWKQHNYHYKSSKPLWFNPNDKYIQHILFDDNIRFEEDGSNVIDLYQFDNNTFTNNNYTTDNNISSQKLKSKEFHSCYNLDMNDAMKWENIYYVQADLLEIIKNRNYFIEKVNECEMNLDRIQNELM